MLQPSPRMQYLHAHNMWYQQGSYGCDLCNTTVGYHSGVFAGRYELHKLQMLSWASITQYAHANVPVLPTVSCCKWLLLHRHGGQATENYTVAHESRQSQVLFLLRHVCIAALPALTSLINRMRAQHTVSSKAYFTGLLTSKHLGKIDVSKGYSYVQQTKTCASSQITP